MKATKSKNPTEKETEIEAEEWGLSGDMGILPSDIPFTQNIGCVGGKNKKSDIASKKPSK